MNFAPNISSHRILYHFPLSPQSRAVRLTLLEKNLPFELLIEKPWERRDPFLKLSPTGDVPILLEANGFSINDAMAACEYLNETNTDHDLLGETAETRAEVRRICHWFFTKFTLEVSSTLLVKKYTSASPVKDPLNLNSFAQAKLTLVII